MLRKQLTEIRQVKENPAVGIERRKLLQQISYKETRRHGSAGHDTQRYRSLSTGDSDGRPSLSHQLPRVNVRSRSQTNIVSFGSGKEELCTTFHKKSWGLNDSNCNSPSERWSENFTPVTRYANTRQRSLSTGMNPRISAWEVNGKDDEIASLKRNDFGGSNRTERERSGPNYGCGAGHLHLELSQNPAWAWEGRRRYILEKTSATAPVSEVKINNWQTKEEDIDISKFASTRKERRPRSYSTNSAPTISKGRVLEVCQAGQNKPNAQDLYSTRAVSSRQRSYSTNCRPKVVEGKVVEVPARENRKRDGNDHHQAIPVHLIRRQRSLTVSCPPVSDSGRDMHNSLDNTDYKMRSDLSGEKEVKTIISSGNAISDDDFHSKIREHNSTVESQEKSTQDGDILLPA